MSEKTTLSFLRVEPNLLPSVEGSCFLWIKRIYNRKQLWEFCLQVQVRFYGPLETWFRFPSFPESPHEHHLGPECLSSFLCCFVWFEPFVFCQMWSFKVLLFLKIFRLQGVSKRVLHVFYRGNKSKLTSGLLFIDVSLCRFLYSGFTLWILQDYIDFWMDPMKHIR